MIPLQPIEIADYQIRVVLRFPERLALEEEIGLAMKDASICGLGQTAYSAVESAIKRLRLFEGSAR